MSHYLQKEAESHAAALRELRERVSKSKDRLALHMAARALDQFGSSIQANTAVLNAALAENDQLKNLLAQHQKGNQP